MSEWPVSAAQFAGLSNLIPALAGATNAYPSQFPAEFPAIGINQRSAPRNLLLGTTVSRPAQDEVVFGVAYDDTSDPSDNEDFYLLKPSSMMITHYRGPNFETLWPQYAATHHGYKDYLRGVASPPPSGSA